MDVNKLLAAAVEGDEARRALQDLVNGAEELQAICESLKGAVASLVQDEAIPLAGFVDSKESQDAFRLLYSAQTEAIMVKLCIYDYMRENRTRCAYCGDRTDSAHGWCGACDPTRD